jgi:hypothetical protein
MTASAAQDCRNAMAVPPVRTPVIAEADGLGVAPSGDGLLIRAMARGMKVNAAAGVIATMGDGSECAMAVSGGDSEAVRVPLPPRSVTVIEAAVCDAAHQTCIPARVELPR